MPKPPSETQVTPDPGLEKRTRREFSADYKLKILAEADACAHGEFGALLRREHLYSNQLSQWRRDFAAHGVAGLGKTAPGPKTSKSPDQRRIEQLEKANARLQNKLDMANDCLELQKKVLSMLDHSRNGNDA